MQATLPFKNQKVKRVSSRRNYVNVYFGLTPELAQKLKNTAEKQVKTESQVLRQILDKYFKKIKKRGLLYKPYMKTPPKGLITLPRTVSKEQDRELREIAKKTGRGISELVREAVERY